jgi:hypothetical protein
MKYRNRIPEPGATITGSADNKKKKKKLVTVTQSVTNVPQTNNTSTSGLNEE